VTTECCKFCGADVWYVKDGDGAFECRTTLDYSWRSIECKVATCARYEALFPVPPWSTEPISDATCRALGMVENVPGRSYKWRTPCGGVSVLFGERGYVMFNGTVQKNIATAGQLAMLIAARKGAVK